MLSHDLRITGSRGGIGRMQFSLAQQFLNDCCTYCYSGIRKKAEMKSPVLPHLDLSSAVKVCKIVEKALLFMYPLIISKVRAIRRLTKRDSTFIHFCA